MDHNIENVVKIIEAMIDNKHDVADWCRKTNNVEYHQLVTAEIIGLRKALNLIIDVEYFDGMTIIYKEDIK